MLKRLLCTVFLAVFCLGNVAYGMSDEAMGKKMQNILRKELNDFMLEAARKECRQAGLNVPRKITITVHGHNRKMTQISLEFSSYVPEELVELMAKCVGVKAVDILDKNGRCDEGVFIGVIPFFNNGVYDGQTVTYENGHIYYNTIPKDKMMTILNSLSK